MRTRGRPRTPGLLTPRESEVLDLVRSGYTNGEIARQLEISEQGVRYHLNQLYAKSGLESREALRSWRPPAKRDWGWLPVPVGFGLRSVAMGAGALAGSAGLVVIAAATWPSDELEHAPPAVQQESPVPEGDPCTVISPLFDGPGTGTCFEDAGTAAVSAGLSPVELPARLGDPLLSAVVEGDDGPLLFRRFDSPIVLDVLDGPQSMPFESLGSRPLMAQPLANSAPPRLRYGFLGENRAGELLLWWCPDDGGVVTGDEPLRCVDSRTVSMAADEATLNLVAFEMQNPGTLQGQSTYESALPTPIPFPPNRGETVEPAVQGIPEYPGAEEVDGWTGVHGREAAQVQVFETADSSHAIFQYLEQELGAHGWGEYHGSFGVAGRSISFTRADQSEWVTITTRWVDRPGGQPLNPAPGFRGKGLPYEERTEDGSVRFFVITWIQEPAGASAPISGNAETTVEPRQTRTVPGEGPEYVVAAGDSCASIAAAYGTTLTRLLEINPEIDQGCTNLVVGQVLRVEE